MKTGKNNCFPLGQTIAISDHFGVGDGKNFVLDHNSYEVLIVQEGNGLLFALDKRVSYGKGDVFFFGNKVRYGIKPSKIYHEDGIGRPPKIVSLFFDKEKMKKLLGMVPEAYRINKIIDFSEYGVKISRHKESCLTQQVDRIENAVGLKKILWFLRFLDYISKEKNITVLSTRNSLRSPDEENVSKLGKIRDFIKKNHKDTITLERISDIANMSPTGFCRFFKTKNKKTFSQYLAEVRIESACGLLRDTDFTVLYCCYASGYNNVSNFHKHFKKYMGISPSEYRLKIKNDGIMIS